MHDLMCCCGEFGEFGVGAEALEASGHPDGCHTELGLAVGMSARSLSLAHDV
jgi:hypothetical protein